MFAVQTRGISFGPTVLPPHSDTVNVLPDGNIRLTVSGSTNVSYTAQSASSVLGGWTSLVTNSSPTGSFNYDDLAATNAPLRFYRAFYMP